MGLTVRPGTITIRGWAWSAVPVTAVDICVRDTWRRAEVEPRSGRDFSWQQFSADRHFEPADYRILARATDCHGRVQPRAGARNQTHSVSLRVRSNG